MVAIAVVLHLIMAVVEVAEHLLLELLELPQQAEMVETEQPLFCLEQALLIQVVEAVQPLMAEPQEQEVLEVAGTVKIHPLLEMLEMPTRAVAVAVVELLVLLMEQAVQAAPALSFSNTQFLFRRSYRPSLLLALGLAPRM
jgi:hypothetical protein